MPVKKGGYTEGRTQKYSTTSFSDSHIDYDSLSKLIERIQSVHGTFAVSKERLYLGIPVGKKVGNRRVKTGVLGLYLEEQEGSVIVAFKPFGRRSKPYAEALDYIVKEVVADEARKTYFDGEGNEIGMPTTITFMMNHRR